MKRSTKYYRPANRKYMGKGGCPGAAIGCVLMFFIGVFTGFEATACDEIYLKVGASYKTHSEASTHHEGKDYQWKDQSSPIGARFELGKQKGNFSYGVAHYSQWGDGWPVNNDAESARTEIFIDYKWSWK